MRAIWTTAAALALVVGSATAGGEWKMLVHEGDAVTEFSVSAIDSLTFREAMTAPPMITVPAGTFIMGDGFATCGVDQREVTLTRAFDLGTYLVTNQEFLESLQWAYDRGYVTVTDAEVLDNLDGSEDVLLKLDSEYAEIQFNGQGAFYLRESPSTQAQSAYPDGYDPADHPVIMVSWFGAARYCDWLSIRSGLPRAYAHNGDWACNGGDPYGAAGYRMPTDAEWEYAAQWNDGRLYPWGNTAPHCGIANYRLTQAEYCVGWTTPVGNYPAAPQELGFYDLGGLLSEWCNDWMECDVGSDPVTDPTGLESGEVRARHSGFWGSYAGSLRRANRFSALPQACANAIGIRIARTAAP